MPISQHLITDKSTWEQLVQARPEANFLQSWNWGVFHASLGRKVMRLAWYENDQPVALAEVVKEEAKRGTYLTIAGGPLFDWTNQELGQQVFADLRTVGQQEKAAFIRFRPQVVESPDVRSSVQKWGAVVSPMHLTADLTLQVEIDKTEDEILNAMRKNTRYEVRRAEKLGITVRISQNDADIQRMYDDQLVLAKQHGFVPFSYEFWLKQFQAFVADDQIALFHAYLGDELLASAFIIFYNKEAVYHYATSTPANAKQPGSYAIQWAVIQEAKRRGCVTYNLWGVAPVDQPNHRFAGLSVFKRGFSEKEVSYLPAHDIPVNWNYGVVKGFELLRKKMRKL